MITSLDSRSLIPVSKARAYESTRMLFEKEFLVSSYSRAVLPRTDAPEPVVGKKQPGACGEPGDAAEQLIRCRARENQQRNADRQQRDERSKRCDERRRTDDSVETRGSQAQRGRACAGVRDEPSDGACYRKY